MQRRRMPDCFTSVDNPYLDAAVEVLKVYKIKVVAWSIMSAACLHF